MVKNPLSVLNCARLFPIVFKYTPGEYCEKIGYTVPVFIHPTAYVGESEMIEKGTVLEPLFFVNANTYVGTGCIISLGAIVDHDVKLEKYCHINAGIIAKAGAGIENFRNLEAGEVALCISNLSKDA